MQEIPIYIYIVFGFTAIITVLIFFLATRRSYRFLLIIAGWVVLQSILSSNGFYTHLDIPKLPLLVLPPLIMMAVLFSTALGRQFIDSLDIRLLTLLHIIRIPVEIVLLWLFMYKAMPRIVTFEGRNFDILSGLSAPFIFYFGFIRPLFSTRIILIWNFVCLGLLINVVANALLSAPTPIQQFAFDQPSIAILHFPFVFLPGCIVPIVLFSHLAVIRKLIR